MRLFVLFPHILNKKVTLANYIFTKSYGEQIKCKTIALPIFVSRPLASALEAITADRTFAICANTRKIPPAIILPVPSVVEVLE